MNKTRFKAHPIMLFRFLKPFLFVLVLPFLKGAVQYLRHKNVSDVWALEFIAFGIIFSAALFRTLNFSLEADASFITVRNGFLLRRKVKIPKSALSSISYRRNIADLMFGSVTFRLNTEAGSTEKADMEFKISRNSAKALWKLLNIGEIMENYRFSPVKIILLSASRSSFITGILVGVPVISYLGRLLGLSVERLLIGGLNGLSQKVNSYFPPVLNLITVILLLFYGISFAASLLKNTGFRLRVGSKTLETSAGLFIRRHTAFSKRRINCILIYQTPLMHLFGLYTVSAAVGGYGNRKGERPAVIPCGRKKEILAKRDKFFSFLSAEAFELKPERNKKSRLRFAFLPILYYFAIVSAALFCFCFLKSFFPPMLFICIVAAAVNTYYLYISLWENRNGRLILSENCSVLGVRRLTVRELNCKRRKIAAIKLRRTPSDRRNGTCKVKLTVGGEASESAKVRNINFKETEKRIDKILNKKQYKGNNTP